MVSRCPSQPWERTGSLPMPALQRGGGLPACRIPRCNVLLREAACAAPAATICGLDWPGPGRGAKQQRQQREWQRAPTV